MRILSMIMLAKPALPRVAVPRVAVPRVNLAKIGLLSNWRSGHRHRAFTLLELLVTIAVLGIVSAVALTSSTYFLRKDRTDAAVNELADWLEAMQAKAGSEGPCGWVLRRGDTLPLGTTYAHAMGDNRFRCTEREELKLPSVDGAKFYNVGAEINGSYIPSSDPEAVVWFTRRSGIVANGKQIIVKISVNDEPPLRCLKVAFGIIYTGINKNTHVATDPGIPCEDWQRS